MKNIARSSAVDQAIDKSSDFRANRSTSAPVCLLDRAVNTEITMMSKSRPVGSHRETYADAACNTEWSCGSDITEDMWSQFTEMLLEEHSDGNVETAERSSQIQEEQESETELCSSNFKRSLDRLVHLDKQAVRNSASSCYQNIQNMLQSATEAQLQILSAHYQMSYQLCLDIYKLALEKNECFSSYVSGTGEADFEAAKLQERKISAKLAACLADGDEPSPSTSSKMYREQYKKQAVEHEAKIMESGNLCSFICIGGLSSSVPEDGLRSLFQKSQITDTLLSVDFSDCRYGTLPFVGTNKTKLAVEEMNKKEMKGKSISVEPVNTSSKNKYLISQVPTNKLWHEIQPVHDGQRNYQAQTVASASSSVKALGATSASEKTDLPVTTSCATQVPGVSVSNLYGANQKDTGEDFVRKTLSFSVIPYDDTVSPNVLNSSSLVKLMMKLDEIHPETSGDKIVDALLEVKKNNNGVLSGLSISSIVDRTSAVLRKSTPSCGEGKAI